MNNIMFCEFIYFDNVFATTSSRRKELLWKP